MLGPQSRHSGAKESELQLPDGRTVRYVRRRWLPQGEKLAIRAQVKPRPDERLDQFANRTLGDPLRFWEICDVNNALDPFDLLSQSAGALKIPSPRIQEK